MELRDTDVDPRTGPHGVVPPVRVDPAGLAGPTRAQTRGGRWRRSSRGLYVPAEVDAARPEQRTAEAAACLPAYGGVTGWAALCWMGARWFRGVTATGAPRPVVLAAMASFIRDQPGFRVCEERLNAADLTRHLGVAVTTAVRSTCFEMRYASSDRQAVVALDTACYDDLVSVAELVEYAGRHSGWIGIPRCRWALPHADENSWSPTETLMRLVWTLDAGLPRPWCNRPVFDLDGRHLATPDLLDAERGVAAEYDGELHLERRRRDHDVRRLARLRDHGLEVVEMTAPDLVDPGAFIGRLLAAYSRAATSRVPRRWTVTAPPRWLDTSTVARRRALAAADRTRLLAYRRSVEVAA